MSIVNGVWRDKEPEVVPHVTDYLEAARESEGFFMFGDRAPSAPKPTPLRKPASPSRRRRGDRKAA